MAGQVFRNVSWQTVFATLIVLILLGMLLPGVRRMITGNARRAA